ncbi:SRPBCC family protein [Arthrobacter ruber]|uniref:SRPBCC family protein n=1 Tax=Arthrobacter ruber TaxID=1258893 RepID=UPI000CF409E8|nr:Clp protease N-terminal domain-containing protein [Arthrobacter ruber]
MSRFTRFAATSQSLSLTAMEEASRRGLREADLEDLFLALVLSDQPAGRALRELGITIGSARAAVEDYQKKQIASLGITASLPPSGDIVFHETGGYEWSKRALKLIERAGKKGRTADADAVLRELLDEPSGLIRELLGGLGTTPSAVLAELDRTPAPAPIALVAPTRRRGELRGVNASFIPAPVDEVWALLSDPARVPEWEPAIGAIDGFTTGADLAPTHAKGTQPADGAGPAGGVWMAHARTTHPDGRPLKVHEKFRRRTLELLQAEHGNHVAWRFTYPDVDTRLPITMIFDLAPTKGGTQLSTTMAWSTHQGWRSILSPVLHPLQRFLIWIRLFQISNAISRTFRHGHTE